MSILDSLPALFARTAGELLLKDATLKHKTSKVSDGRGGWTYTTETVACRALVTEYSDFLKAQGIPSDERKILVQAHGLESVIEQGESITVADPIGNRLREWSILDVGIDPAGAMYELRCKGGNFIAEVVHTATLDFGNSLNSGYVGQVA